jgi:SOS response regulatory protein OraA/RecX
MTKDAGADADKQTVLAALKILAREKGSVTRLRAQLPGEIGKDSAARAIDELDARGVLAVQASAARVPASLQSKGNAVIRQRLAVKLLREEDIEAAISDLPPEAERAISVARKKWPTVRGRDDYDRANKLMRFLLGRGFALDACREAARTVAESRGDDERCRRY